MRSFIAFLSILFMGWNASAQENILSSVQGHRTDLFVLDSFYHWNWDTIVWSLEDKTLYGYDANQDIDREIIYVWDGAQWIPDELTLSDYDDDHHLLFETELRWNGTVFEEQSLTSYTFDANHDQTVILFQNWSDTGWVNSFQQLFTFDNNHNILTRISQYWTGTDWGYNQRQEYTYENDLPVIRLFQGWNGTSWYDISRSLSTYDTDNNLDTLLYQKYLFNGWTDDYRTIYDYDANHNRTLILEQLAVGIGVWENQDKYEYTYDQYDKITHLVNSQFENNAWQYIYQYNVINDDDHNRVTEVFQTWENEWENQDSTQYYYTNLTGVKENFDLHSMTLFPNPVRDMLNIEFEKAFDGQISMYNLQGKLVAKQRSFMENVARLDVSDLVPGQYIIVLRTGNSIVAKSFQKL